MGQDFQRFNEETPKVVHFSDYQGAIACDHVTNENTVRAYHWRHVTCPQCMAKRGTPRAPSQPADPQLAVLSKISDQLEVVIRELQALAVLIKCK